MYWILVVVVMYSGHGVSVTHIPVSDERTCKVAAHQIKTEIEAKSSWARVVASCAKVRD